jgi:dihydrofolate reductase
LSESLAGWGATGRLIYSAIASLDGYIEDDHGGFDWAAAPDAEVHAFVNELERPVGTYLYGRRIYETMVYWEHPPELAEQPAAVQDYARIWQAADKIVYSRTLQAVTTARTRVQRKFDAEAVRELKATAAADLTVGVPSLRLRHLPLGWSMRTNCSSCLSWLAAGSEPSRMLAAASTLSC